jgi:hypothetical protein
MLVRMMIIKSHRQPAAEPGVGGREQTAPAPASIPVGRRCRAAHCWSSRPAPPNQTSRSAGPTTGQGFSRSRVEWTKFQLNTNKKYVVSPRPPVRRPAHLPVQGRSKPGRTRSHPVKPLYPKRRWRRVCSACLWHAAARTPARRPGFQPAGKKAGSRKRKISKISR